LNLILTTLQFIISAWIVFGITQNCSAFVYNYKHIDILNVDSHDSKRLSSSNSLIQVQLPINKNDTIKKNDTLSFADTLKPVVGPMPIEISSDTLEHIVDYHADSIHFDFPNNTIYLKQNAIVTYGSISLEAAIIEFNIKDNTVTAFGITDSFGNFIGRPDFSDGDQSFTARKMAYNFSSQKGKIYQMITAEGEGFIHAKEAKKDENNQLYGRVMKYTTCDHEEPHFWIEAKTIKVIPNEILVCGPTNLVIEGVRTPLILPFAIFPINPGQRSGLIFPEFGEATNLGFGITNGGYYYGNSDFVDLSLTGDIYTSGSWRVRVRSNFAKKYKYNGNFSFEYGRLRFGDELTGELTKQKDFKLGLGFTLNQKAWPNNRISASINLMSNTYNQFNTTNFNEHITNTVNSSIRYSHIFKNAPLNFSLSFRHSQNTINKTVSLTLPEMNFGVSRLSQFKRKISSGGQKWYEKIGFNYTLIGKNFINIADSLLFTKEALKSLRFGFQHKLPVSASFKAFNYFTFSPFFNYNEDWYFERIEKRYDPISLPDTSIQYVQIDTIRKFSPARYFNFGAALSTRIYGRLNFKSGKLKAIRHVMTPFVSFNYRPDFAGESYGYYQTVQTDPDGTIEEYSVFPTDLFSPPPKGKFGGISFSLDNNLEMKVFSKSDTINQTKKIKILESLKISSSYNFAADSLELAPFRITARTTIADKVNVNFSSVFDPYALNDQGQKINVFELKKNKRLLRLVNAQVNVGASFRSKTSNQSQAQNSNFIMERIPGEPVLFYDPDIPWDVSLNYVLNINKGFGLDADSTIYRQSFTVSGNLNITPKWRINMQLGYDIVKNELSYATVDIYRDLHCWEMRFRWVPVGVLKSYNFGINVKSNILKDLKLQKKSNPFGSYNF